MALFQKKPQIGSQIPLYTVGLQQVKLIIGLGNHGKKYDGTRHNIGFTCLDSFAKIHDLPAWREQKDLQCVIANGTIGTVRIILAKPTTFMNLSGEGAQKVAHFYKIRAEDMIVVHDELDIPFGQIRSRAGGSSAGHNGVQSLIDLCGDNFGRLRIGIQSPQQGPIPAADFVLQKFSETEQSVLPLVIKEVVAMIEEAMHASHFPVDTRSVIAPVL